MKLGMASVKSVDRCCVEQPVFILLLPYILSPKLVSDEKASVIRNWKYKQEKPPVKLKGQCLAVMVAIAASDFVFYSLCS